MKLKNQFTFSLFIAMLSLNIGLTSCAKKTSNDVFLSPANQEKPGLEPALSVIYANNVESNMRLSEDQIRDKFNQIASRLYPSGSPQTSKGLTAEELSLHLKKTLAKDPQAQAMIQELATHGVYFGVDNPAAVNNTSRYGDSSHIKLTDSGTLKMLEALLSKTGDWMSSQGGFQEDLVDFSKKVKDEDYIDPIFFPQNKLKFFIDLTVNSNIKYDGEYQGYIKTYEVNPESGDKDQKELFGGIVTISHFWDPDAGWNKNPASPIKAYFTNNNTGVINIGFSTDPQYLIDWINNPPSAYFKALCFWYGWTKLRWEQKQDRDKICYVDFTINLWLTKIHVHEEWKCGKVYGNIQEVNPVRSFGVVDYLKTGNKSMAIEYLAHVVHLLQDMSVPTHAHGIPHGAQEGNENGQIPIPLSDGQGNQLYFSLGGTDLWEKHLVEPTIDNVIKKETYRFEVTNNAVKSGSLIHFTSVNPDVYADKEVTGSFFHRVNEYYTSLEGTFSLFSLFFNTAQASQFFPVIKTVPSLNTSGGGLYFRQGNTQTSFAYHSAITNFLLGGTSGFNQTESYNDYNKFDTSFPSQYSSELKEGKTDHRYSEKGTYYIAYVGDSTTDPDSTFKYNFINNVGQYVLNLITVDSSANTVKLIDDPQVRSNFKIYYIGFPYNRMAEHLLPLAVASTSRLMRNYYRLSQ